MPIEPQPCGTGAGEGGADVEQLLLCDLDAEGNLLGTALAVYEYDSDGNPVGPPTFVDPTTGDPYVVQGTLQPCPDGACLPPMQFCQTSTTTGPVEHPGRQYDITLPINPGFAVDSLQIDAVNHPAGITWSIFDVDGDDFAGDLESFIQGRVPAGATVSVTNPNSGVSEICGAAQPMTIHIECVRLDQSPPNLIELVYNGGEDLVQNPAYNTTPPTDLSQFQFYYLQRQDAGGTLNCTSVANRGWETNDLGNNNTRDFEVWGTGPAGLAAIQNTTPTPRGTPVQEITADINDTGPGPTIWQTINVPAPGNFRVQLVHGARDPGETHTIRLSTGDTNDTGPGDIINDVTNPASVTNSGGPNPWTVLDQTVPLNSGLYTFSFTTTNPVGNNRGGLFTDMRVYIDRPGLRATAVNDDDTCVVTVDETGTNTICSYWQPQCAGGVIVGWQKVDTGESMSNAEFWAQVPTPGCCPTSSGGGGGSSSTLSNMIISDVVCAVVGGIAQNAIRVVVTDPSGGTLQQQFLGANGAPIAPDSWTAGPCTSSRFMADQVLCDDNGPFLRKYVQSLDATNQPQVNSFRDFTLAGAGYTAVGAVQQCGATGADTETTLLCDVQLDGTSVPFIRSTTYQDGVAESSADWQLDGTTPYAPTGLVQVCQPDFADREGICYTLTSTGATVHAGWARHQDTIPNTPQTPNGIAFFDSLGNFLDPTADGFTVVPCAGGCNTASSIGTVCYTPPVAVETIQDDWTGATSVLGGGSRVWTNSNFAGEGITVTETVTPDTGAALLGAGVRNTATSPATQHTAIDLGAPRTNVTVRMDFFGNNQGERLRNITPAFGAVSGNGNAVLANTGVDGGPAGDGTIFLTFPGPVQTIEWDYAPTGSGLSGQSSISFNTGSAANSAPAAVLRDCETGDTTLVDLATGTVLDPATISIVDCPGEAATDTDPVTIRAQHRLVAAADPAWTPAEVTGTLVSLTATVLAGSTTVLDQNGTSASYPAGLSVSWSAEDRDILNGPTSIDSVSGSVLVHWTER